MLVIFVAKQCHVAAAEVFICHCHERTSDYWSDREWEPRNNQQRENNALSMEEAEGLETEKENKELVCK